MTSSPKTPKEKLSLRKCLFLKKPSRVGCLTDKEIDGDTSTQTSDLGEAHNRDQNESNCTFNSSHNSLETDETGNPIDYSIFSSENRLNLDRQSLSSSDSQLHKLSDEQLSIKDSIKHNSSKTQINKVKGFKFEKQLSADQMLLKSERVHSPDDRSLTLDRKTRKKNRPTCIVGSADSLVRQSLLAAQVLRLIPTEAARSRNYLYGRIATNSLLGTCELEHVFPNREIKIFVGTWNMNGQPPPKELDDFVLPNVMSHVPEMCVIGTQESYSEKTEWEIRLQEVLGPSHVLLHSAHLGTLHLTVFIRRDLIWFCSLPEDASYSVRPGAAFKTKGAVAISFALFGSTFLFVTAHLTAHQEKVKERVSDIKRIVRALDLPKNLPCKHRSKDVTNNFDYVIWSGDLNFRISEPREAVLKWIDDTEFPLPTNLPNGMLHSDQLTTILADGAAFRNFHEAPITFPPSYKYNPGTQQFDDSSKQRVPSYTDRILYKCKQPGHSASSFRLSSSSRCNSITINYGYIKCLDYNYVPSLCSSDHKPVWALFAVSLRPGSDNVPLAAGLFNRDVYLEGIKRRAATINHEPGTSTVCVLQ